ncbi:MAG TPA: RNA polymerase sigma factor [Bacteroidota bacterium]|nr:RNA polymerase sigma factor [Bacteroidota bacterium]
MNSRSDTELMLSVRDGRIADLAPLFERHNGRLFNFYVRMTGDRQLSEDMVQDVFLRILKYRHTFRGESRFLTWMFTIARNVQMDNVKRWNREQPLERDENNEALEPVSNDTVDHRYDAALLKEALLRLTPEKREALILSRYEGMKYAEIAEFAGCSVENVKVRVHRAIRDLRKIFLALTGETAR